MQEHEKTIAVVLLHGECDMRCLFCVTDPRLAVMTPEYFLHTLEVLSARGYANIVIGGGEPFCWPHGLHLAAQLAKERGFYVQVGTNGVNMPNGPACPEWIDRYVLPLDAAEPALHNHMRPLPAEHDSHFAVIMRRLEQLKRHHRSVTVSTVVSRQNLDGLVAIGNFLADYVADGGRLHAWHLYRFIPEGRGGRKNAAILDITTEEYEEATDIAKCQRYPYVIYKRPNMRHSATVDFFWYEQEHLCIGSERWGATPDTRAGIVIGNSARNVRPSETPHIIGHP